MIKYFGPTKIVSGVGAVSMIKNFVNDDESILVVTDKTLMDNGVAGLVLKELDDMKAGYVIYDAVLPSPTEDIVNQALEMARENACSVVVAIGGGSPIDVGKIVAFLLTNPGTLCEYQWEFRSSEAASTKFIAIPTTSGSGSEVGNCSVIVSKGMKGGIEREELFPPIAILDPAMTCSMPPSITSTTGIDAFTHAYEAFVGVAASPFTDAWAWEAMRLIIKYLPRAFANGNDLEAREQMSIAAAMAGVAKDNSGLGIVHASTDAMGGRYNIPHGLANSVFLPFAVRYNMISRIDKHAQMAQLFDIDTNHIGKRDSAELMLSCLKRFLEDLCLPHSLRSYLVDEQDLNHFVKEAANGFLMKNNSRKPSESDLLKLYRQAFGLAEEQDR